MKIDSSPLTGKEEFWGNYSPSKSQLDLMNKSPLLRTEINDASEKVKAGQMRPFNVSDDVATAHAASDGSEISLATSYTKGSDKQFVGVLAHELGYPIYAEQNRKYEQQFGTHPCDPEAFNSAAMPKGIGQTEAELNKWKISREIEKNTATPGHPGTTLQDDGDTLFPAFDAVAKKYANSGLTPDQMDKRLVGEGSSAFFTSPDGYNISQYDHTGQFNSAGAVPTEPGGPTSVTFETDDNEGNVKSATQKWKSGDTSTQTYKDGQLQSSQTVDAQGKPLRTIAYSYHPDGGYSMSMSDGAGRQIRQSDFNADGSGVERSFNADGSRKETQFDNRNQTTLMTTSNPHGREVQKDYFSRVNPREVYKDLPPNVTPEMLDQLPPVSRHTSQVQNHPDGSSTRYSFNDNSKVGLQDEYDASGHKTATYADDPGTGRLNSETRYNPDSSRTSITVGANDQGTRVDIGKDGRASAPQNVTFTPAEKESFGKLDSDALKVDAPQPVGSETTLGGEKNYFDPTNNRRTSQEITNPDGTRTVSTYDKDNVPSVQSKYGADGHPISTTHFDQVGRPSEQTDYNRDGGRVEHTSKEGRSLESTYNPTGQLTQLKETGSEGSAKAFYDPSSGQVTNYDAENSDGTRTVYSMNNEGKLGTRTEYDANGHITRSTAYDPTAASGTLTDTLYRPDGTQQVEKFEGGNVTSYVNDSDGNVSAQRTMPMGQAASNRFNEWKTQPAQQSRGTADTTALGTTQQSNVASSEKPRTSAENSQQAGGTSTDQQAGAASTDQQSAGTNSDQHSTENSVQQSTNPESSNLAQRPASDSSATDQSTTPAPGSADANAADSAQTPSPGSDATTATAPTNGGGADQPTAEASN